MPIKLLINIVKLFPVFLTGSYANLHSGAPHASFGRWCWSDPGQQTRHKVLENPSWRTLMTMVAWFLCLYLNISVFTFPFSAVPSLVTTHLIVAAEQTDGRELH